MYPFITVEESKSINYFRIPKQLFTDEFKDLSTDAKLLYGLMLERTGLSQKNNWVNENGYVYIIYTIESMQEELACSHTSIHKYMDELEIKGLIEKQRQGLGKPNLIFVKSLLKKVDFKKSRKFTSRSKESLHQEVKNLDTNKTEYSKTDINNKTPIVPFEERFKEFWKMYPRKQDKAKAFKAFKKAVQSEQIYNQILMDLEKRKYFKQWEDKKYVPLPTTYLNGERWLDEYELDKDNFEELLERARELDQREHANPNQEIKGLLSIE